MGFLNITNPYELKDLNKETEDAIVLENNLARKSFFVKDEFFEITEADRQIMKLETKERLTRHLEWFAHLEPNWCMCPKCKEWTEKADPCCGVVGE